LRAWRFLPKSKGGERNDYAGLCCKIKKWTGASETIVAGRFPKQNAMELFW
jgi:hypothetical protein